MDKIKLVVFDIAGTTVHDNGNVAYNFIDAFTAYGYDVSMEEVNRVMGYRKMEAIEILLENRGVTETDQVQQIHDTFINGMIRFYKNDPSIIPLPFAEEMFLLLRKHNIKIALNTGFTRSITDAILHKLQWTAGETFDFVISSDEVDQGRPSPSMIKTIMNALQIENASHVVKVGDTEVDILEGRNSGCGLVVSVTTGAFTKEELQPFNPDYIISSLEELPVILNLN